jgi:hypothetical protein
LNKRESAIRGDPPFMLRAAAGTDPIAKMPALRAEPTQHASFAVMYNHNPRAERDWHFDAK